MYLDMWFNFPSVLQIFFFLLYFRDSFYYVYLLFLFYLFSYSVSGILIIFPFNLCPTSSECSDVFIFFCLQYSGYFKTFLLANQFDFQSLVLYFLIDFLSRFQLTCSYQVVLCHWELPYFLVCVFFQSGFFLCSARYSHYLFLSFLLLPCVYSCVAISFYLSRQRLNSQIKTCICPDRAWVNSH